MSMLSEQVKELRKKADELRHVHADDASTGLLFAAMGAMREAADTIESLRDRLQAERTCGNVGECELQGKSKSCSKCGASVERVTHSIFEMGDGFACRPNFCPNCGAKVTND